MKLLDSREAEFWMKAYLAAMEADGIQATFAEAADCAIKRLRERLA